jgi:flagellar hook protein FlgE
MSSFSIAVAGMLANEEALGMISNNLANMNTVGYKTQSPEFSDLVYQQMGTSGGGDPIQIGLGSQIGSTSTNYTEGSIQSTGVPTNVAIQGGGFLQVQTNGLNAYTRDGDLTINSNGYLVTQNGGLVMGYGAPNGVVQSSGVLQPLVINSNQTSPGQPTQNVTIGLNLNAATPVGQSFSTTAQVYDSLGNSHLLTYTFTNSAANSWSYQITIPGADVGQTNPVVVNSGTLTFNGNGTLTAPTSNVTGIKVSGLADGANTMNFAWNLYDSSNNPVITQVASPSSPSSVQQDGYSSGTLVNYTIGSDGTIQGTFSNGRTVPVGQIALATFPNSEGLLHIGSNEFISTLASGLPAIGTPGTGGRGTITDGALENSNVDIADQFAQLISAQNGYQSNTKSFSTINTVIQDTFNLIP